MKKIPGIILIVMLMLMLGSGNTLAAGNDAETLVIKGDAVSKELLFSRAELEAMSGNITQNTYSVSNNFPTDKTMYRKGVSLLYLLQQAGIKDNATQLKFTSSDGYSRSFTYDELLKDERYYFTPDGSKTIVPTMIAFLDGNKGFNTMNTTELVLTMGQRVRGEQTNPWFVKYLETIEVSSSEPEQWAEVAFNEIKAANGRTVELKHRDFDAVKIYYTSDGSNPTINSKVYNVSASYYQPELNKPVALAQNAEIKAIAIGAGKRNSTVASTADTSSSTLFNDLAAYDWAGPAIADLTQKGIISGVGDSRFAPGDILTRAQFAKIMVLASGAKPGTAASSSFSDVKSSDWYCAYVQKAAEMGLVSGYADGTFRPDQALSRQEMLTVIIKAMGLKIAEITDKAAVLAPFTKESRISDWARSYVALAEHAGLLEHGHLVVESKEGCAIDAQGASNRAEAAITVYRMLQSQAGK